MIVLFIFLFAATLVASVMAILNARRADKLEDDMAQLKRELTELREEMTRLWDRIEKDL